MLCCVLGDEGLEGGLVVGEGFDLGGSGFVDVLHCLKTCALSYTESVDAFRVLGYQGGHLREGCFEGVEVEGGFRIGGWGFGFGFGRWGCDDGVAVVVLEGNRGGGGLAGGVEPGVAEVVEFGVVLDLLLHVVAFEDEELGTGASGLGVFALDEGPPFVGCACGGEGEDVGCGLGEVALDGLVSVALIRGSGRKGSKGVGTEVYTFCAYA